MKNLKKNFVNILASSILFKDLSLTRLLATHNHSYTISPRDKPRILRDARTVDIAKQLIQHEAQTDVKDIFGRTLLHQVTDPFYEPALISLYRSHGVNPMERESNDDTPLSLLLSKHSHQDNVIKKAALLLTGLTPAQRIELLNDIHIIEEKYSPEKLTALKIFLKKTEEQSLRKLNDAPASVILEEAEEQPFENALQLEELFQ